LESAKNQKLYLDPPDPETSFQPFVVRNEGAEGAEISEGFKTEEFKTEERNVVFSSFEMPSNFLSLVNSDPQLQGQLEDIVNARVEERINVLKEEARLAAQADGRAIGIEQGREEGLREVQANCERLSEIAGKMLERKAEVLKDHEALWCRAFSHLLKRFLIPRHGDIVADVNRWLETSLENFSTVHKLKLYLSTEDFELLRTFMRPDYNSRVELVKDSTMKNGEVHCETDAGGIFFSPQKEAEKLDELIQHFVTLRERE
jgi:flagellar biosynthesis/type III secretory pathway protein FliH